MSDYQIMRPYMVLASLAFCLVMIPFAMTGDLVSIKILALLGFAAYCRVELKSRRIMLFLISMLRLMSLAAAGLTGLLAFQHIQAKVPMDPDMFWAIGLSLALALAAFRFVRVPEEDDFMAAF